MKISLIASVAKNYGIGKTNDLLWHLPDDLKHFKNITTGHSIVMGKKTFDSIGKPLPNRRNIIITKDTEYEKSGCEIIHSPDELFELAKNEEEVFIIGGGQIFKLFLPFANKLYITTVNAAPKADVFFPNFDKKDWNLISSHTHTKDDKHEYSFSINIYEKK